MTSEQPHLDEVLRNLKPYDPYKYEHRGLVETLSCLGLALGLLILWAFVVAFAIGMATRP